MTRTFQKSTRSRTLLSLTLLVLCCLFVPLAVAHQHASAATGASDDFNRAAGGLGAGWADFGEGGLSIASQQVLGSSGPAGDIRTAESYASDQYSQIEVTSTQLGGGEWIGPAVRTQSGGLNTYLGVYFWNDGSPELRLYKRIAGMYTQLGPSYPTGPLPAGTQLRLVAVGSMISFLLDGITRISVTDDSITGGAPALAIHGPATTDNWTGGNTSTGTHSVGGTVSGLTGTLLLQNNGGDDLSVSSNGPFAFEQLLTDGEGYSVTVERDPDGQTCAVDDPTGSVTTGNVTTITITCTAATLASDAFDRANGGLGAGWSNFSDGGLSISTQQVLGTSGLAGNVRTAELYGSDQYSQIEVTSTQLSGGEWVGPAVRAQAGGQNTYLGIYFWNNGNPELRVYERVAGDWTQLGPSYATGPLPAGTQLRLVATGSTISFLENGITRISVTDSTITGGAPAIASFGPATDDNWTGGPNQGPNTSGGTPGTKISYDATAGGIATYDVTSPDNGTGTTVLRVLTPTDPARGVPHNFLYVLPVEPGLGTSFGDGIETMLALDAANKYNLTIVEPSFGLDPWYADNPSDQSRHYESFLTSDLVPWVTQTLAVSGNEQNWLIGFSKSGIGAQDLILRHPDLFALAASWDFPADMSSFDQFGSSSGDIYGTDVNFQVNYQLTPAFLDVHKAPFTKINRIWIGGGNDFPSDVSDYDSLLTAEGIQHSTETTELMTHGWGSGWVPIALAALSQDSADAGSGAPGTPVTTSPSGSSSTSSQSADANPVESTSSTPPQSNPVTSPATVPTPPATPTPSPTPPATPTPSPALRSTASAAVAVTVTASKTVKLGQKRPVLTVTVKMTKPAELTLKLLGKKSRKLAAWSKRAHAGKNTYALLLPTTARRSGRHTLVITQVGARAAKRIAVTLIAGR
jgi:Putative esterase